jgi:hypothetical protein
MESVTNPNGGYGSNCNTEIWRLLNNIIIPAAEKARKTFRLLKGYKLMNFN